MNKTLLRIFALILVPCLISDPVAAAVHGCLPAGTLSTVSSSSRTVFNEQALQAGLVAATRLIFGERRRQNAALMHRTVTLAMTENTPAAKKITELYTRWFAFGHVRAGQGPVYALREIVMLFKEKLPQEEDKKIGHTQKLLDLLWPAVYNAGIPEFLDTQAQTDFAEALKKTLKPGIGRVAAAFAGHHAPNVFKKGWVRGSDKDRTEIGNLFLGFTDTALDALVAGLFTFYSLKPQVASVMRREDFETLFREAFYKAHGDHDADAFMRAKGELLAMGDPGIGNFLTEWIPTLIGILSAALGGLKGSRRQPPLNSQKDQILFLLMSFAVGSGLSGLVLDLFSQSRSEFVVDIVISSIGATAIWLLRQNGRRPDDPSARINALPRSFRANNIAGLMASQVFEIPGWEDLQHGYRAETLPGFGKGMRFDLMIAGRNQAWFAADPRPVRVMHIGRVIAHYQDLTQFDLQEGLRVVRIYTGDARAAMRIRDFRLNLIELSEPDTRRIKFIVPAEAAGAEWVVKLTGGKFWLRDGGPVEGNRLYHWLHIRGSEPSRLRLVKSNSFRSQSESSDADRNLLRSS